MDSPKRMENNRTGTKTSTGAVPEIPNSECPHPHSKMAFMMPREAPIDRRFMRSEERRGGKKGRSRWSPDDLKKKKRERGRCWRARGKVIHQTLATEHKPAN